MIEDADQVENAFRALSDLLSGAVLGVMVMDNGDAIVWASPVLMAAEEDDPEAYQRLLEKARSGLLRQVDTIHARQAAVRRRRPGE